MELVDFLGFNDDEETVKNQLLRQQAVNILDSYHQEWDVLSELFQNAIDAIDENENVDKGLIRFVFDKKNRQISAWDNGVGVDRQRVSQILRLGRTYKNDKIYSARRERHRPFISNVLHESFKHRECSRGRKDCW